MTEGSPGRAKTRQRLGTEGHEISQVSTLSSQHRLKNMLANIRALAAQTYHSSETLDEFYEAFEGRLQAIALTHIMLGQRADGMVNLADLILEQLVSHAPSEQDAVTMDGPDILLDQDAAQTFALVVHELMTNALTYGALASKTGRVAVRWAIEDKQGRPHLAFAWQETGVSLASAPGPPGFGRRLIEEALPYQLGGKVVLSFPPEGCEFRLTVPLDHRIRRAEAVEEK